MLLVLLLGMYASPCPPAFWPLAFLVATPLSTSRTPLSFPHLFFIPHPPLFPAPSPLTPTFQFLGACTKQKPYIVLTELMACSLADAFTKTFYAPTQRRQVIVRGLHHPCPFPPRVPPLLALPPVSDMLMIFTWLQCIGLRYQKPQALLSAHLPAPCHPWCPDPLSSFPIL